MAWLLAAPPAESSPRARIELELDRWSGQPRTRAAILKITNDPVPALAEVAKSDREPELRRKFAIGLLATFKGKDTEEALLRITDDSSAKFRCLALKSLIEIEWER